MKTVNPQFWLTNEQLKLAKKAPDQDAQFVVTSFLGTLQPERIMTIEFLPSGIKLYETITTKRMITFLDIDHGILIVNDQAATQQKLEKFKEKIHHFSRKIENWETVIFVRSHGDEFKGEVIDEKTKVYFDKVGVSDPSDFLKVENARLRGLFVKELLHITMYIDELRDIESSATSFEILKRHLRKLIKQDQILSVESKNSKNQQHVLKLTPDKLEIQDPTQGSLTVRIQPDRLVPEKKNADFINVLNQKLERNIESILENKATIKYKNKPRI